MAEIISLFVVFVFGVVVGSFLNVVSLRFGTGVGIRGRSKCMSCGTKLSWKELIPLFSFLFQKGSCRTCRSKISWQYPLVEFSAGIVFTMIFFVFPPVSVSAAFSTALYIFVTCVLFVISIYDMKHKVIPDSLSYIFAGTAFVHLFVGGYTWFHIPSIWDILAGPILALPIFLLWLFSRGAWIGLGDAKLLVGVGWLIGLSQGINALILSFWIAAGVSLVWLFWTYKKFKPKTEIPFGPYLVLGLYLVLLFGIRVMDIDSLKFLVGSYFGV